MRPTAYMYTCRNLGQVALLWPGQPAPMGPGWIDVKAEPLVRLSDVEALLAALKQISEIEDELFSGDWDEIEQARQIALTALKGVTP